MHVNELERQDDGRPGRRDAELEMGGKKYHLNLLPRAFHITEEGRDTKKTGKGGRSGPTKTHYFFEAVLTVSRARTSGR
jgi:hypothetical protein